ncbi:pentapeptide repeat-containing protein [Couchioplanes caeruleus]|uniref:Pentapeptide repeat protein n=2 Tax=Couchioplanes caeruleus TaxID=56438 RepID=A0A1K0GYJ7_9ACTN|nr:pentapeptide repeat-containing protein [Couchioplanes caeruleus]OJF14507.1 hypothetical protein BG844_09200 [Couchioplanes caeruleus subsp. caeruleus]ROP21231.1 pentapeptide repeat protein [Couchioplanes caeruleus]
MLVEGADLSGAQLRRANLRGAQLPSANLREAQLQGAYLSGAQLQGATLFAAQLQRAFLFAAQLQGADLEDANVAEARLYDKRDDTTVVVSAEQLAKAKGWQTAILSEVVRQQIAALQEAHAEPEIAARERFGDPSP